MKPTLSLQPPELGTPGPNGSPTADTASLAHLTSRLSGTFPTRRTLLDRATHPVLCLSVSVFCIGLLAWSLFARLPLAQKITPSESVRRAAGPATAEAAGRFGASDVARLRDQAESANAGLVSTRADFARLLTQIETSATQTGLRPQLSVSPPTRAIGGFTNLIAYRAAAEFTFSEPGAASARGYDDLLAWMASLTRLPQRTEITDLVLVGDERGLSNAHIEFRILGQNDHGDPDPK